MGRLLVWVGLLWVMGCDQEHSHPRSGTELRANQVLDEVVATVAGRKIGLGEFTLFWASNAELTKGEAISALVERELVLVEALKQNNLGDSRERVYSRKQGLVRAVLDQEIALETDSTDPKTRFELRQDRLEVLLDQQRHDGEFRRYPHVIEEEFVLE